MIHEAQLWSIGGAIERFSSASHSRHRGRPTAAGSDCREGSNQADAGQELTVEVAEISQPDARFKCETQDRSP